VENAADTLPPTLRGDGDEGLGGSASGMVVRDGGVSGAPNIASNVDGMAGSGRRGVIGALAGFSSGAAGGSLLMVGVNLGENGGVR
jgi:hypothetical protein